MIMMQAFLEPRIKRLREQKALQEKKVEEAKKAEAAKAESAKQRKEAERQKEIARRIALHQERRKSQITMEVHKTN